MVGYVVSSLALIDDYLWSYVGVPFLVILGLYLSIYSGLFQIRAFPRVLGNFYRLLMERHTDVVGVHPVRAFFASIGGAIGIGNVVAVCTAVQIGGPGALFWIWITALLGMLLKYSEIYLGLLYRVPNSAGSYDGGPMYFHLQAFKGSFIPKLVCVLLCIYGVEIFMFSVMASSLSTNFHLDRNLVIGVLLIAVLVASVGGVERVGRICSAIIPLFILLFMVMSLWVIGVNFSAMPGLMKEVLEGAFTGHAATGAFAGSTLLMTISQGVKRGCYTGDVGVGYASIIHSESSTNRPERQASLGIFGIFLDTFVVCTLTLMVVLITGAWKEPIGAESLLQEVFRHYFVGVDIFMPVFIFLLGYSTMIAYMCVGFKCAQHLSPKWGKTVYLIYAVFSLLFFSYVDPTEALIIMSLTNALLLVINSVGMFILHRRVRFTL